MLVIKTQKVVPHKTKANPEPKVFLRFLLEGVEVGQMVLPEDALQAMKSGEVQFEDS